jgi:riboflavin synthase
MMFTGIIREVGVVKALESSEAGARITVAAPRSRAKLVKGGSIAVDGVCLTATELGKDTFAADAIPETLRRTRLGGLANGSRVNLELPLRAGDLLDGHIVQGHVDGLGEVVESREEGTQKWVTVRTTPELARFFAYKGSVAINGVSLTVAEVEGNTFSVALIPTTLTETNLDELRPGARVNLEVDVLARYVARLEETRS